MPSDDVRGVPVISGLLAGISLRVRLVALACCLVAVGAVIIGLACRLAAGASLMWQADQQVRAYTGLLTSRPFTAMPTGPGPDGAASGAFAVEVISAGQLVLRTGPDLRPGPALAGIPAHAGQLATVPADSGGGSWLVIAEPVHYSAQRILFTYGSDGFFLNVASTARPGTAGTLVVGVDLSSVSQASTQITADWAAVSGAVVLAVAVLGVLAIGAILRPRAQTEPTAARSELTDTCHELRRQASIIRGLADYYHRRGPLTGGELDRMMGRVAGAVARADALIDHLQPQSRPGRGAGNDGSTGSTRLRLGFGPSLSGEALHCLEPLPHYR